MMGASRLLLLPGGPAVIHSELPALGSRLVLAAAGELSGSAGNAEGFFTTFFFR